MARPKPLFHKCKCGEIDVSKFSLDTSLLFGLSRYCLECASDYRKKHYRKNISQYKDSMKKWSPLLKSSIAASKKKYADKNKKRELIRKAKWKKDNPAKVRLHSINRLVAKSKRSPPWLTDLHKKQIEQYYKAAVILSKNLNTPIDVDHIVPLQGKIVSGLHVPWNLQLLRRSDNCSKSNKFE